MYKVEFYSSFKLRTYRWKKWEEGKKDDEYSHHVLVFSDPLPGFVPFYKRRSAQAPQNYWCEGEEGCKMSMKVPLNPMNAVGPSFEPTFCIRNSPTMGIVWLKPRASSRGSPGGIDASRWPELPGSASSLRGNRMIFFGPRSWRRQRIGKVLTTPVLSQ